MARGEVPRVVAGVDGSAESLAALEWAATYVQRFGGKLTAVAAWHIPTPYVAALSGVDLEAEAQGTVIAAVERVQARHPGLTIGQRIVAGSPGKVLVADSEGADLLVVGTRRALGSVSSYSAHYASCPMVIVRGEEGQG